MFMVLCIADPY